MHGTARHRARRAAQRGAALRDALQSGAAVTRAAVDAGFNSPSRLYESVPRELGMSPSAFRRKGAGLKIDYATADTRLGVVLVAATSKGICKIAFGDAAAPLVDELRTGFANAQIAESPERIAPFIAQVDAYLNGTRRRFELPLDLAATEFQQRVWDALRRIPYGETRSYTQIAEALGAPRAVRAVARACAANPVALAIPCHRVVQKGGSLAGYRWGLPRKAALLDAEAQRAALARKVAINAFIVLLAAFFVGTPILHFFGISLEALRIGGGLAVAVAGWQMLNEPDVPTGGDTAAQPVEPRNAMARAFFPLTIPLTTGPGSIATAIALNANRTHKLSEFVLSSIVSVAVSALAALVIWQTYSRAAFLARYLGTEGTKVAMRVSAFLLLCVGVQIMLTGFSEFLRPIADQVK